MFAHLVGDGVYTHSDTLREALVAISARFLLLSFSIAKQCVAAAAEAVRPRFSGFGLYRFPSCRLWLGAALQGDASAVALQSLRNAAGHLNAAHQSLVEALYSRLTGLCSMHLNSILLQNEVCA